MNGPAVLFAWRRTPPPLLIGGAEVSQQLLAEEFARAGWHVIYLGSHQAPWDGSCQATVLRTHLDANHVPWEEAAGQIRYRWNGVDCHAVSQDRVCTALTALVRTLAPELVITSLEGSDDLAALARIRSPRVAGWLHSVSTTGMNVLQGRPHVALATSRFVAGRAHCPAGTQPVIFYPPFAPAGRDRRTPGDGVLMVNPVPAKGSALVHELIRRLPEQRFTLVEGWWDTAPEFMHYPNVRYIPRTYDMVSVYASHRLLLVPSQVEDAFPRVIIEAGLHGVATLGSDRGGIPEAVADGGLILPPDGPGAWAKAITTADRHHLGARAWDRALQLVRPCLPELAAAGVIASADGGY
ncbi:glycosyltransferase [Streptomyces sp. NRRL F-5126]|uniref:glycosyltransferase n=1 Tax=Streptomyces sp. NRRL F-5126 TaxID=1463857 RepID=UPI0004C855FE|nr:glycosyltransferase [Streptomyces sp. NRRL F-5126]